MTSRFSIDLRSPVTSSPQSDILTTISTDSISTASDSPTTPLSLHKDILKDICFADLSPHGSELSPIRPRFQDTQNHFNDGKFDISVPLTDYHLDINISKKILQHVGLFYKVYQAPARLLSSNKPVVIAIKKLINPTQASDIVIKEARILARLATHENIIDFYGLYGNSSLISPWYSTTLGNCVLETIPDAEKSEDPWIGLGLWTRWSQQLLSAVQFIHSHGIIHCDIKPDNILLDDSLSPMLADFSSAQFIKEDAQITPALLSGASSIEYTAPELLRTKSCRPCINTDVFSLGMVMLYAATGHAPYHTASKNAVQKLIWAQQGAVLEYGTDDDSLRCSKVIKTLRAWLVDRYNASQLMELIS